MAPVCLGDFNCGGKRLMGNKILYTSLAAVAVLVAYTMIGFFLVLRWVVGPIYGWLGK
jgi:hypothetical protein